MDRHQLRARREDEEICSDEPVRRRREEDMPRSRERYIELQGIAAEVCAMLEERGVKTSEHCDFGEMVQRMLSYPTEKWVNERCKKVE